MAQRTTDQKRRPKASDRTWQQTKSAATRSLILDAALDCFYELGYARTTTEQVARKAGVSRGAMLHHFPSRFELIHAAVEHLSSQRLATFERAELRIQRNEEHTRVGDGIDAYWRQLSSKPFIVFHELQVAARTDPDLRKVLLPAIREFDARWVQLSSQVFPDLSHSRNFALGNLLTTFLLEGMAVSQFTRKPGKWVNIVLDDLKARLDELFEDVVGVKSRSTEPRQIIGAKPRQKRNPTPSPTPTPDRETT
jgi:AcrR family transcriptional regulator